MKKMLISILMFCLTNSLLAQIYTPIDTANYSFRCTESDKYLEFSKDYVSNVKSEVHGKDKSGLKKRYKMIDKYFSEDIRKGQYIFQTDFNMMLDSIVNEIVINNPNLSADLKFYLSRNITLNAASLGNKCFYVNLGAFIYTDNECQVASIISHEIGHYLLRHAIKDIQNENKIESDKDLKNEVYNIKTDKYKRGEKAQNMLKQILYEEGELNKKQEFEADSIGYLLYKNTKFKRSDYLGALKLMAEYDTLNPIGLKEDIYLKAFDFPDYPFKKEWLKMEDFSKYDYSKYKEKFDKDSINSHPQLTARIDSLKKRFPELNERNDSTFPSSTFTKLQKKACYEMYPCLMFLEEYGIGVYFSLLHLQYEGADDFQREWMGKFLNKIYEARKSYTLNRYLERIVPRDQSKSYQQFLSFMWNLSLNDIKELSNHYNKTQSISQ